MKLGGGVTLHALNAASEERPLRPSGTSPFRGGILLPPILNRPAAHGDCRAGNPHVRNGLKTDIPLGDYISPPPTAQYFSAWTGSGEEEAILLPRGFSEIIRNVLSNGVRIRVATFSE